MTLIRATEQRRVVVGEERFLLVDFTDVLDASQSQVLLTTTNPGDVTVSEVTTSDLGTIEAYVNTGTPTINGRTVAANKSVTLRQGDDTAIDFSSATAGQVYVLLLTATTSSPTEVIIGAIEIEVEASPT